MFIDILLKANDERRWENREIFKKEKAKIKFELRSGDVKIQTLKNHSRYANHWLWSNTLGSKPV